MAALPSSRVIPSPPFNRTAIDYFGPLLIKSGNVRSKTVTKAFVAVFVCLVTKAIHLECVTGLTTEAFIAAITRFTAHSAELWSDNATCGCTKRMEKVAKLQQNTGGACKKQHTMESHSTWLSTSRRTPRGEGAVGKGSFSTRIPTAKVTTRRNSRPLVALHDEPKNDTMICFCVFHTFLCIRAHDTSTGSNRRARRIRKCVAQAQSTIE